MSKENTNNNPFKENDENLENIEDNKDVNEETSEKEEINWEVKYNDLNNQYIRLAADFDNFRKRQSQERESLLRFGTEEALRKMLVVLDNFERGEKSLENVEDIVQVKESFNIIHKQLIDELKKLGLDEIETVGKEFDPNFHEAVMQTPSEEHKDDEIIAVLQKGYKYNDKVLRAALVNVAKN